MTGDPKAIVVEERMDGKRVPAMWDARKPTRTSADAGRQPKAHAQDIHGSGIPGPAAPRQELLDGDARDPVPFWGPRFLAPR